MKKILKSVLPTLMAFVIAFLFSWLAPLDTLDNYVTDILYSRLRATSNDIIILTVDSQALDAYGPFTTWSREKTAQALEMLYADPDSAPAVVGIDITFQGESDADVDARLAKALENSNSVLSASLFYKGKIEADEEGKLFYNSQSINMVEKPAAIFTANAKYAFTNAQWGKDSVVRYYKDAVTFEGERIDSFARCIAKEFSEKTGKKFIEPNKDRAGNFRFFYAGKSGEVEHVSLKRYLDGEIPQSAFKGKIVLIGVYASGMQDSYSPTKDIGGQMYGVEIQSNVIQSYFDGSTATGSSRALYALIVALVVAAVFFISNKTKMLFGIVLPVIGAGANIITGIVFANKGTIIPVIYSIGLFILMIAYSIIRKYVLEAEKRRHITKVFGRYMEPKIVAAMAKGDANALKLGGDRREVAVLFVDVRGFTKMSEALEPEDIVGILNEYLGLVTDCIFKHGGMLDKFVGDCAMAVYNAPIDQEDYLYQAVATAWDIAQGYVSLAGKLEKKYGRSVSYGIGVNCGPAVVGNIGCDFRMDYTAIGDTVNTAARLEANAETGQILISKKVKEQLEGRIQTEFNGMMQFKGKAEAMEVYRVVGI